MATIGYATLDVIPSLKGLQGQLTAQSKGPLAAAGKTGGAAYGQSAGKEAASTFATVFERTGRGGGDSFGRTAGKQAGGSFVSIFQRQVREPIISAGQLGGQEYGTAAGQQAGSSFAETFQGGLESSELIAGAGIADIFQDSIADVGATGEEAGEEFADGAASGLGKLQGLLASVGVAGIFKDLVDQGSAAEQSVGGVRAVFGEFAAGVEADSAKAAQALGLSSTAYQELITISGALLKNKGLADYADQADRLIQTGADLAAQFGGTTADAVGALNAALRGESDPIERYAISLNETAVNARLAATGQGKLTGAALDQAKVTARLAIIQEQSADAMGAFGREANTQAGQTARATAAFADLRAELGLKILPAASAFTGFVNNSAIPALSGLADFAVSAVQAFKQLPGPVQTAAAAFVALRVAALTGLTSLAAGAVGTLSTAFLGLTSRVLVTRNAFVTSRASAGLFAASLAGLRAGAAGAATALAGLGRALLPIAAVTAVITVFSKLSQAQQNVAEKQAETKARVDALTDSLDKQSGAITELTRETVKKDLLDKGVLEAANALGVSLQDVTNAALGNADAYQRVKVATDAVGQSASAYTRGGAQKIIEAVGRQNDEVGAAQANMRLLAEADGKAADSAGDAASATSRAAAALQEQATSTNDARTELRKLIIAEKERHDALLSTRQDALALEEQISNARDQSREGADKGINARTKAGQENRGALYDLIDQFNNADPKVRNAEGNFERVRSKLLEFADSMGVGEDQAKRLIDQLLRVPKTAPIEFQSKGFKERMNEIRKLREAARQLREDAINRINYGPASDTGGIPYGRGGTSPNGSAGAGGSSPKRRGKSVDLGAGGLAAGGSPTIYNYNGNVTYTDDEQGRRRAKNMERRAAGDGSRRR